MEANPEDLYCQAPPPDDNNKKVWAITAVVLIIVLMSAIVVVLITGLIKIGHPKLISVVTSDTVDEKTGKPGEEIESFTGNEERIYCCAKARAFDDTVVRVEWRSGDRLIREQRTTFGEVIGSIPAKCLTSEGYLNFYLERPKGGWLSGTYEVTFQLGDIDSKDVTFTVGEEGSESSLQTSTYEDPQGLFSIDIPVNWYAADPDSLGGGLAGFLSDESGDYPPRVEILATNLESVSTEYLNGTLAAQGVSESDFYNPYNIDEQPGAVREFTWTYAEGDKTYELHSIQYVVQGEQAVYGLNFHCLAADYEKNQQLFTEVAGSFRVSDSEAE